MADSPLPPKQLNQQVQYIKGVGPNRAALLEKLGIRTAADLLFFFPRTYQDFTELHQIPELENNQTASIVGYVDDIDQLISNQAKHVLYVLLKQENQFLRAVWFGQPFMLQRFQIGQRVMFQGKVKLVGGRFQMNHPKVVWLDGTDEQSSPQQGLHPVYPLTEGLNQRQMREIVAAVVQDYAGMVQEAFPEALRDKLGVCDIETAIRNIHAPTSEQEAEEARLRLVYQELFILQLALAIRRHRVRQQSVSPALPLTPKIKARILGRLPFELTPSQQQAFEEIAGDMQQTFPMNRLLHGEVGSGKTAVAICAMLLAVAHGYQAVLMAPTEILAQQHYRNIRRILHNSRVRFCQWTGSLKGQARAANQAGIESGEVNIVIGTQAVVASELKFHQLGLVVIDEQHKFGVRQRASLKQSGHDPHYLVMTATPIPRTVSMTLFGDLELSTLQRTSGIGQQVHTYLGQPQQREAWWEFVRKKIREGRQAFVIAPRVDNESEEGPSSAEQLFERLSRETLRDFRLEVLHGRLSSEQKEIRMEKFSRGETQVLVATGVVEVGIDVPNATVMTIESAERFGLSQLHQLRGRVSRGQHPGYVCVFASNDSPEANERLAAFAKTSDGFELAEIDLQLRGPGNLFSSQQSGFPPLLIADLVQDAEILARAQQDARALIAADPELKAGNLSRLRQLVFARYGQALEMSDVG
jgi:ATP-dependent DNA helicase RecG